MAWVFMPDIGNQELRRFVVYEIEYSKVAAPKLVQPDSLPFDLWQKSFQMSKSIISHRNLLMVLNLVSGKRND
jgi:hypothetical protein